MSILKWQQLLFRNLHLPSPTSRPQRMVFLLFPRSTPSFFILGISCSFFSISLISSFSFISSPVTSDILGFYKVTEFWVSVIPSRRDTFVCLLIGTPLLWGSPSATWCQAQWDFGRGWGQGGVRVRGHFHSRLLSEFLCRYQACAGIAAVPAASCSVNNLLPGEMGGK